MNQELKAVIDSPKFLYSLAAFCLFLFAITLVDINTGIHQNNNELNQKIIFENDNPLYNQYVAYVKLGVAPSTYSRQPTQFDVDTGIKLKNGDDIYSLYESRTLKTGDIGKSFVVKIN